MVSENGVTADGTAQATETAPTNSPNSMNIVSENVTTANGTAPATGSTSATETAPTNSPSSLNMILKNVTTAEETVSATEISLATETASTNLPNALNMIPKFVATADGTAPETESAQAIESAPATETATAKKTAPATKTKTAPTRSSKRVAAPSAKAVASKAAADSSRKRKSGDDDEPPAKRTRVAAEPTTQTKDAAPAAKNKRAAAPAKGKRAAAPAKGKRAAIPVKEKSAAPPVVETSESETTGESSSEKRKSEDEEAEPPAKRTRVAAKPTTKTKDAAPAAKKKNAAAPAKGKRAAVPAKGKRAAVPAKEKRAAAPVVKTTDSGATAGSSSKKRKSEEEDEQPIKRVRATPKPSTKPKVVINKAPTTKLNVYVFGEGGQGELALGSRGNVIDVKRPRLNPLLSVESVGVVQIAVGGMHACALTHDNKILTWGVNDQGALGRDTTWTEGMVDADGEDADSDDASEDVAINPRESNPVQVDSNVFPEGIVFTQVAAGDSITLALTDEGFVYGCGTFRSNEGVLGFSPNIHVAERFVLIKGLKKITKLVCGDNHVLALDHKGAVFAFGAGQQNQLGRRVVERTRLNGLIPREFGLPRGKITDIAAGAYHSMAFDKTGKVWGWGLNSYGQTGVIDDAGEDDAATLKPTVVKGLAGKEVVNMAAGAQHTVAITSEGECLTWGRCDGSQTGLAIASVAQDDIIFDAGGKPRILAVPTAVSGMGKVVHATAGTDTTIVVTEAGQAYSWGFSENYQTGLGTTTDVVTATLIANSAIRDVKVVWAGAGGQFGVLASEGS